MSLIFGGEIPSFWGEAVAYHNVITSGVGLAFTYAELGRLSANRVARIFSYMTIYKQVEVAQAA